MFRQTLGQFRHLIPGLESSLSRAARVRPIIVSNSPAQPKQAGTQMPPRFDWNPLKYNFDFSKLKEEYAKYCVTNNIENKFNRLASQQPPASDINSHLQTITVLEHLHSSIPQVEMAGKRQKQAKKKRSKRKNGGHQSIRF